MTPAEFTAQFMKKYHKTITSIARKYLIPNRYSIEDIHQYIAERILTVLTNRQKSGDPILNKENYFKGCLTFYCVEFQRMHGFIFCLPKRPRRDCLEQEEQIKSYGFVYLNEDLKDPALIVNEEEKPPTYLYIWKLIKKLLTEEEVKVLECLFFRNMTYKETAEELGISKSMCSARKMKAFAKIFTFFDDINKPINEILKELYSKANREAEKE